MSKLILPKRPLWWGYLDNEGIIHIKRYTNDRAIQNSEAMPFVKGIFDPFEAWDYEDAKKKCYERWKKETN